MTPSDRTFYMATDSRVVLIPTCPREFYMATDSRVVIIEDDNS